MHRFLFRPVYTALNSSVSVYESCVSAAKCEKAAAPVFRVANGRVKAFSTNSVRLCEKKNDAVPSNQDEEASADKETETASLVTLKATDASEVIKTAEQSEEPVASRTDGSSTQREMDVKSEQVAATPTQVQTDEPKSGKENLLKLLEAMKVDVTSKRKFRNVGVKQQYGHVLKNVSKAEPLSASERLDPELVAAASAAASTLPNSSQAESELLQKLRQHEAETVTEVQKKDMNNIAVIIADMKISKNPRPRDMLVSHLIQFDEEDQRRGVIAELPGVPRRRTLFTGKRLDIFSPATDEDGVESSAAQPTLWDMDFAYQLSQAVDHMPCNGLEEMIQWTKEGKMWQYPIDNEAGLEEEASVLFYEHVFLEKHLEEGFPSQGPVRHFMELVVAGLSRNPYLTVHQKREHISWFRDYFSQKEGVLNEAGVHLK